MIASALFTPPMLIQFSAARYHNLPQLSRSQLWTCKKSPKTYHRRHVAKDQNWQVTVTEQMQFGTHWHDLVLENNCDLERCVTIIPEDILAKNGARSTNAYREFEARHDGEWLLRECELGDIREMLLALKGNPYAAESLFGEREHKPQIEQTMLWTDHDTGLGLRCRFDQVNPGVEITDLKMCHTCDRRQLNSVIEEHGYYFQGGVYQDAWEQKFGERLPFVLIVSEPKIPFRCVHVPLAQDWLDRGKREAKAVLRDIARRQESGDWSDPECNVSVEMNEPHYSQFVPVLAEG